MNTALVIVTLFSVAVAAATTLVAIRMFSAQRRQSDARVEALARDIHDESRLDTTRRQEAAPAGVSDLFVSSPRTRHSGIQLGAVAVAATLVALIGVGLATSHAGLGAKAGGGPVRTAEAPATAMPLELLALAHEQADDHLTVHGVVRNPARGMEVDHLTAVVLVFNQQGAFLTSGRAAVDPAALVPGTDARFTITISGATDVGRYRVSFRSDDSIVAHVDRRERS